MADILKQGSSVTPEEARAGLARFVRPLSEVGARELDAATLKAMVTAWHAAIDRWHRFRYCPACGQWILALFAAEHVSSCFAAPAVARAARAEAELRALSTFAAALGLPAREIPPGPVPAAIPEHTWAPVPRDGVFRIRIVFDHEARKTVDLLADRAAAGGASDGSRESVELPGGRALGVVHLRRARPVLVRVVQLRARPHGLRRTRPQLRAASRA